MPDGTYYTVQMHADSWACIGYSTREVRRKRICTRRTLCPHRLLPQGTQTTAQEQEIKSYQKKNQIWNINVIEFAGENIIVHKKLLMYRMYDFVAAVERLNLVSKRLPCYTTISLQLVINLLWTISVTNSQLLDGIYWTPPRDPSPPQSQKAGHCRS